MPVKTLTEHTEWVSQEHMTISGKEATLDRLLSRVGTKHMDVKAQTKTRGLLSVLVLDVREGDTLNSIDSDEERAHTGNETKQETKTTNNRESKKTQTTEKTYVPPKRKKP